LRSSLAASDTFSFTGGRARKFPGAPALFSDNYVWNASRIGRFPRFETSAFGQLPNQLAIIAEIASPPVDEIEI
jgi:hypothetical protein